MYAHLLCGNREIFVPPRETVPRAASGRPEAIADDERGEEVRLIDGTCEAGEQSGAIRRGVGGGRRWDQEECGTAKHGPDTESGSRDTSAGPHTRSRNQEQEGEADSALASRQPSPVSPDRPGRYHHPDRAQRVDQSRIDYRLNSLVN